MPQIPTLMFTEVTKPAHFKVAVALYNLADFNGIIRITTKELSAFCNVSESTLTRAFRDLESKGFLTTTRSRKGYNRFSENVYAVRLENETPSPLSSSTRAKLRGSWANVPTVLDTKASEAISSTALKASDGDGVMDNFLSLRSEGSTAGPVANRQSNSYVSHKGKEILRISSPTGKSPVEISISNSEKPKDVKYPKLSVDPKDFRTRARRPVETWTTWDVAAEFADRLQHQYPKRPLLINKKNLAGALLPMRAKFKSTPQVEMVLMKWFFEDRHKVRVAERDPQKVIGVFLNTFKTDLERAKMVAETPEIPKFVYANDGKRFDNSMPGRRAMKDYNQEIAALANPMGFASTS